MSPILKRDVGEQLRQARRLAAVTTGLISSADDDGSNSHLEPDDRSYHFRSLESQSSGGGTSSSRRMGIGVDDPDSQRVLAGDQWNRTTSDPFGPTSPAGTAGHAGPAGPAGPAGLVAEHNRNRDGRGKASARGKGKARDSDEEALPPRRGVWEVLDNTRDSAEEDDRRGEQDTMLPPRFKLQREAEDGGPDTARGRGQMEFEEPEHGVKHLSPLMDLRNLLLESTPSLLVSLVGLVFTGELLEHLARWRVFRRVDELFILVPMLGNLKGNLEMCLSARLGTSANIGELDHRPTRRSLLLANMTLLGLQALLISCLAAVISFVLGLITIHRLGDSPPSGVAVGGTAGNGTMIGMVPIDPGLAVGEQEWHEGYTRPGWKQLVMVLATGMGAAGISSAVLGSFMGSMVVMSRWAGIDPDNITPPVAACLGDLLTLFILALLGTALVGAMDTPIPLLAVIVMSLAAGWFTRRVMRNEWVKNVAKGGWVPLICAMLISSGTGMVLDKGVGKYRGFALLAISMTGLTGSIGAIHANRLSTLLHTNLHPASLHPRLTSQPHGLSPIRASSTLYALAFPCQAAFLLSVSWAGWIDLNLGWAGWLTFAITTAVSLSLAHFLTLFFWSKDLDPDSYTLPIHSALVDFIGQLLLMLAYELCIFQGKDVLVKDV